MFILRILAVGVALLGSVGPAHAIPFFRPDLPDFYQHQKSGSDGTKPYNIPAFAPDDPPNLLKPGYDNGSWWEDRGGWCCIAAFTNSFYSLDKHGFPGLFDHSQKSPSGLGGTPADQGKTWQERMTYGIEDLAIDTFGLTLGPAPAGAVGRTRSAVGVAGAEKTIPDFLAKYGYGPDKLSYSEFFLSGGSVKRSNGASLCGFEICSPPPGSTATTFTSLFDTYYKELLRGEDVEFRIEYPSVDASKTCPEQGLPWWCHSYHIVTGAGVEQDKTQRKLWFADPNDTIHGVDWGHPYTNGDALPVGVANYTMAALMADQQTFANGPYAGAEITRIFAISPVPEPSTLMLLGSGLAGLAGIAAWRKRHDR